MDTAELNVNTKALSMIAHKLRTPLSIINGYCEAVQAQNNNTLSPFSAKALAEISVQGTHLSQLVDKLITFNKVFALTAKTLDKKEVELKPVIKHCAERALALEESLSSNADKADTVRRGAFVETDCPDKLFLNANEEMLGVCMQELLLNAIKFNNKTEKVIKIQCLNHGNSVSLSVRDYGTGIRPQDVNRIFEPFYQVDDDLTGQVSGWGLGLTMVRRIVELHGGTVSVVSDRGLGSIFTVNLPL